MISVHKYHLVLLYLVCFVFSRVNCGKPNIKIGKTNFTLNSFVFHQNTYFFPIKQSNLKELFKIVKDLIFISFSTTDRVDKLTNYIEIANN